MKAKKLIIPVVVFFGIFVLGIINEALASGNRRRVSRNRRPPRLAGANRRGSGRKPSRIPLRIKRRRKKARAFNVSFDRSGVSNRLAADPPPASSLKRGSSKSTKVESSGKSAKSYRGKSGKGSFNTKKEVKKPLSSPGVENPGKSKLSAEISAKGGGLKGDASRTTKVGKAGSSAKKDLKGRLARGRVGTKSKKNGKDNKND